MRQAARHHSSVTEELEVIAPSKLAIEGVSKSFRSASGTVLALDRVSLNVAEGEFVCLVGASGCGKTNEFAFGDVQAHPDRKSTRLNSSHITISYAVFCLKKKTKKKKIKNKDKQNKK